jgi:hypothetical protein
MPKVASTTDGFWDEVFPTASQPGAGLGAQINHKVVLRPYSSAAVCSSIAYSSANGFLGSIAAVGPKSFLTVGAVKHSLSLCWVDGTWFDRTRRPPWPARIRASGQRQNWGSVAQKQPASSTGSWPGVRRRRPWTPALRDTRSRWTSFWRRSSFGRRTGSHHTHRTHAKYRAAR